MSSACTCVAKMNFGVLPVHCRLILPVLLVSPSLVVGHCFLRVRWSQGLPNDL
jgi:hypothetical protein